MLTTVMSRATLPIHQRYQTMHDILYKNQQKRNPRQNRNNHGFLYTRFIFFSYIDSSSFIKISRSRYISEFIFLR